MELLHLVLGTYFLITIYQVPTMSQIPAHQSPGSPHHSWAYHSLFLRHMFYPLPNPSSLPGLVNLYLYFNAFPVSTLKAEELPP